MAFVVGVRVDEVLIGGGVGLVVIVTGLVSTFLVELESRDELELADVVIEDEDVAGM